MLVRSDRATFLLISHRTLWASVVMADRGFGQGARVGSVT
jgi:hypothetical protein